MKSNHVKRLTDIALSAFLSVKGHRLLGVEGAGKQAFFIFESTAKLEADELAFFNREGDIDALSYSEAIRNFKALAVQREREGRHYGYEPSNYFQRSR